MCIENKTIPLDFTFDIDQNLMPFIPKSFAWCWKRDSSDRSRTVLFQPFFEYLSSTLQLVNYDFFYRQTGPQYEMKELYDYLRLAAARNTNMFETRLIINGSLATIEFQTCIISPPNLTLLPRLLAQSPRTFVPTGVFPKPTRSLFSASEPFVIYCGSGVSYEAGLPTLGKIHEHFYVDSIAADGFIFGLDDRLPIQLAEDLTHFIGQSARFYAECATASPTPVHRAIASLQDTGRVPVVLTDNVDMLLEKAGARTTRVRTVFPHSDGALLPSVNRMLIVGVAADRRGIIAKARAKGMTIHVVNPMTAVSPRAQNLSYIQAFDKWYRMTASEFFSNIIRDHYA